MNFGDPMQVITRITAKLKRRVRGSVFVEYLLLATLVGIGVIAGLGTVRLALLNELQDLATAINAINSGS
jgi:pilus assembly protein Flp/PilA